MNKQFQWKKWWIGFEDVLGVSCFQTTQAPVFKQLRGGKACAARAFDAPIRDNVPNMFRFLFGRLLCSGYFGPNVS